MPLAFRQWHLYRFAFMEHRNTIDAAQYVKGLFFSQPHGVLYPQVCVSF